MRFSSYTIESIAAYHAACDALKSAKASAAALRFGTPLQIATSGAAVTHCTIAANDAAIAMIRSNR